VVSVQHDGTEVEQILPDPYEIKSIRSVAAPKGASGGNWHRYEICQGHNQIIGFRSGDIANVTAAVERIVYSLNDRRRLRRGRVHVVLQPKA
jgi:hypothetical protein